MSKEEKDIEQLKATELSLQKQNKQAQDAIDGALAEVDRLKTVASEMEKVNKDKLNFYQAEEKAYESKLVALETNTIITTNNLRDIESTIEDLDPIVFDLKDEIIDLRNIKTDLERLTETVKAELTNVTKEKHDIIKDLDISIQLKKDLIQTQLSKINEVTNTLNVQTEKFDNVIAGKNTELQAVMDKIAAQKAHQIAIQADVTLLQEAINTAINKGESVKAEIEQSFIKLEEIKVALAVSKTTLDEAKKEQEIEQAKLKELITKRIDSVNFIEQLNNRENNLKQRYQDVGLEYPQ